MSDLSLPSVRLAPADMQSQRIPGRKRGRPPLHSTPMKMAVRNLYSASAGALPAVKIPKKRGRKPGYKVRLHHLLSRQGRWAGPGGLGQSGRCSRWGKAGCWGTTGAEASFSQGSASRTGPHCHTAAHNACCPCRVCFYKWESKLHQMGKAVRRADF